LIKYILQTFEIDDLKKLLCESNTINYHQKIKLDKLDKENLELSTENINIENEFSRIQKEFLIISNKKHELEKELEAVQSELDEKVCLKKKKKKNISFDLFKEKRKFKNQY
jgi:hypothetical protein